MRIKESIGVAFENACLEHFETLPGYKYSTMSEDRYTGADFYMDGVPVDVTLNYKGKKGKMRHLGSYKVDNLFEIRLGVRYHNSKMYLDTPVLVIGFINDLFSHTLWEVQQIDKDVFETLFDMYWNAVDYLEAAVTEEI